MRKQRISVNVASSFALISLLVAAMLIVQASRNDADAWQWVIHTRQVLERLQEVRSVIREAESAQRGYLLTGRQEFLAELEAARRQLPITVDAVAALTADNLRQQAAIPQLRSLADRRFGLLQTVIDRSRSAPVVWEQLLPGRQVMGALNERVGAMMAEEYRLLTVREQVVERARRVEIGTIVGEGLLALALVAVLRAVSRRDARLIGESAARTEAVFRAAPAGLGIADAELRLTGLNAALAQFLGTSTEAASGRRMAALGRGEAGVRLSGACESVLRSGVPTSGVELASSDESGQERSWLASIDLFGGPGGQTGVIVALSDVTSLKTAERNLAAANQQLERRVAERTADLKTVNDDLQAFAHTVAHDLRAPLRNIEGFATALVEDEADRIGEEGRLYLSRIRAGARRMDQLITDLLTYSRMGRADLKLERVSLGSSIAQALQELEAVVRESGGRVDTGSELPDVLANRALLVQVIGNLVANAIKFVAKGTPPLIRIEARRQGDFVHLLVDDNGIGIPAAHRERVFGVFERLHGQEAYPGTGIGLAIVRRAVTKMRGSVALEDSPAGGLRVVVSLRAAEPGRG